MSRQIQVNSRDDCDRAATASARQTSVAFAAGQKQNAAQRSDRQPEPLPASLAGPPLLTISQSLYPLTPQSHGPAPLLLRVGVAHETTNTQG